MLPAHVRFLVMICIQPDRRLDFEACLEKRLTEKRNLEGEKAAKRYLRNQTAGLMIDAAVKIVKLLVWFIH